MVLGGCARDSARLCSYVSRFGFRRDIRSAPLWAETRQLPSPRAAAFRSASQKPAIGRSCGGLRAWLRANET